MYKQPRARWVFVVLATLLFGAACGPEMIETERQLDGVKDRLKQQVGVRPEASFRYINGRLDDVEVIFAADEVATLTVDELESHVRDAVYAGMTEQPQELVISLSGRPKPKLAAVNEESSH